MGTKVEGNMCKPGGDSRRRQERKRGRGSSQPGRPPLYNRACRLAEEGRWEEARELYEHLRRSVSDPSLKALIANDLAALSAAEGDLDGARRALKEKELLEAAPNSEVARSNLALLEPAAEPEPALATTALAGAAPPVTEEPPRAPVPVAILSFLFNWPSTGGGIVHTVELAQFLVRAGYEVQHFYAQHEPWGVGRVESALPFPSQAIAFDESDWTVPQIQERFRRAVAAFDPDCVIITDSWNMKPLLAEAVHDYPYILRFQALECLCPLNNVRLLLDDEGRFQQCPFHQLAAPEECGRCLQQRGHQSGALHQAERALSGVGTPGYHQRLVRALGEAEAGHWPI